MTMNTQETKPLVIGHRGAAGEAPENTLASFLLAVRQGADAIELDIHLSADDRLVVCHDATVDRTTDGEGRIRRMSGESLKRLDAGSRFSDDYAGERIPFLEEVFEAVPETVMINVEIKHSYDRRIEPILLELMRRMNRTEQVVVSSFDHKSLLHLKRLAPDAKIGLLYHADFADHAAVAGVMGVPVFSLHPHYRHIGREDIAAAQRAGLAVYPYTINAEEELRQAVEAGAAGIITDYPARLRALLDSRQ